MDFLFYDLKNYGNVILIIHLCRSWCS